MILNDLPSSLLDKWQHRLWELIIQIDDFRSTCLEPQKWISNMPTDLIARELGSSGRGSWQSGRPEDDF